MIGKIVSFLAVVAVAAAAVPRAARTQWVEHRPYEGVDPNTLSCEPLAKDLLLLPSYNNCSQFYMCNHGEEVLFECAPAVNGFLYFDFELQTCNWPWATPCYLRTHHVEETPEEADKDSEDSIDVEEGSGDDAEISLFSAASATFRPVIAPSTYQANNSVAAINCNNAESAAEQLPYKGDCQRYWKCVGGVPQTFYCSDGLFFNAATMQCDHEGNVLCSVQIADELNGEFMVYQ